MKKLLLLLTLLASFSVAALAQEPMQQPKKSKDEHAGMSMTQEKTGGKSANLTGCVSAQPNAEGMYTLSNAQHKKGVEIGPADKVKEHAGHQVTLTGKWSTAAEAGDKTAAAKEKGERHFEVDDVKHISETCTTAPGGGTMGSKKPKAQKKPGGGEGAPQQ